MNRLDFFNEYWQHVNETQRRSGGRVLDLGMGMPSPKVFKTPLRILQKLHESIDEGDYNLYVPPEGEAECLDEIAEYENASLPAGARPYTREHIMLIPGGIQAFSLILTLLVNKEDRILVPTPSYFSLSALSELRGRTVTLPGNASYNFTSRELEAALVGGSQLRLMWFCQPNNPTGLYIQTEDQRELIEVGRRHQAHVVLDESCDNFRFNPVGQPPENITAPHVIRIRTFSKDPNFAGYRLGYLLADPGFLARLKEVAPILYGNPTVMATRAITTEFKIKNRKLSDTDYDQVSLENFKRMEQSRNYLYGRLKEWAKVQEVILPDACYYMFVRFDFAGGSRDLFKRFLAEELLNVVPGVVFGAPEAQAWARICFARPIEVLADGIARMMRVVNGR